MHVKLQIRGNLFQGILPLCLNHESSEQNTMQRENWEPILILQLWPHWHCRSLPELHKQLQRFGQRITGKCRSQSCPVTTPLCARQAGCPWLMTPWRMHSEEFQWAGSKETDKACVPKGKKKEYIQVLQLFKYYNFSSGHSGNRDPDIAWLRDYKLHIVVNITDHANLNWIGNKGDNKYNQISTAFKCLFHFQ